MESTAYMTVDELYNELDRRIPPTLSCSWDNDGLSVCFDPAALITGVVVALDITDEVIDLAISTGCNVIVTHHPLLFHGLKAINGRDLGSRRVLKLFCHGVAAMSFHTRLDTLAGGVNDTLATVLGLSDVTPFGDDDNPAGQAMGRMGTLAAPMSLESFAARVREVLSVPDLLETGDAGIIPHLSPMPPIGTYAGCGREVYRVAVLGGGGDGDASAAEAAGADTYVTGDLKYHQLCDAHAGSLNLIAAGHYFTEFPVCLPLARMIREICPGVPVHILGGTPQRSI